MAQQNKNQWPDKISGKTDLSILKAGMDAFIDYASVHLETRAPLYAKEPITESNPTSAPDITNILENADPSVKMNVEDLLNCQYIDVPKDLRLDLHQFMVGWTGNILERKRIPGLSSTGFRSSRSLHKLLFPTKEQEETAVSKKLKQSYEAGKSARAQYDQNHNYKK